MIEVLNKAVFHGGDLIMTPKLPSPPSAGLQRGKSYR
jgi:hypothetical protein